MNLDQKDKEDSQETPITISTSCNPSELPNLMVHRRTHEYSKATNQINSLFFPQTLPLLQVLQTKVYFPS